MWLPVYRPDGAMGKIMTESVEDYALLHAMPLGVCIFDRDYVVRFWNRCLQSWTRIPAADIVGQRLGHFFPNLREPKFTSRFEQLFQGGPPVIFSARLHGCIIPSVLPGGMTRLQHTVARALRDETTAETVVLMTMQDMTEAYVRVRDYARMHETAQREIEMRRRAEAVLRESEQRFVSAFEYAANGMALLSLEGEWMKANQALCSMLGYREEELLGRTLHEFTLPEDRDLDRRKQLRLLRGHANAYQIEKRVLDRQGRPVWVLLSVSLVRNAEGAPGYFIAQVENITRRKELERELYVLATTDHLTGLSNRREFLSRAEHEVQRSRRQQTGLALLMVDIDNFKAINDTWGHGVGDAVLRAMADTCREVLRATDVFGRLGGEEFGIVLADAGREKAEAIADRVRAALAGKVVQAENALVSFTVSIGVAVSCQDLYSVTDLMRRADAALYEAKSRGRNQVCVAGDSSPHPRA